MINTFKNLKTNYKYKIDEFFSENNKEITNICKKSCKNTSFDHNDLYAELYIYLIENEDKITNLAEVDGKTDKPLMRFIAQWCYNNIRLFTPNKKSSNFKAKYSLKEIQKTIIAEADSHHTIFFAKEIIQYDEKKENIKEKHKKECKLQIIEEIYKNLDEIDKKLFDAYFKENLTFIQISEKYKISIYSAKKMTKEMLGYFKHLKK